MLNVLKGNFLFVCLFFYQQTQKCLYPQVSRRCSYAPYRSNHRSRSLLNHLPTPLHSPPLHQNHWAPRLPSEYNSPASCHFPICTSPQLLHRLVRSIPHAKNKENVTFEPLIDVSPSDSCFLPDWYWQQILGSYSLFFS